jgi:hypothetical protein
VKESGYFTLYCNKEHAWKIDKYENTHLGLLQKTCSVSHNEMCKHAMNPAHYGHMSIDEEMYCADNIMVAHYNMN